MEYECWLTAFFVCDLGQIASSSGDSVALSTEWNSAGKCLAPSRCSINISSFSNSFLNLFPISLPFHDAGVCLVDVHVGTNWL